MALTAKQKRFVDEYLIDLNASQAALRAGYSEKTARSMGAENLTKPDIRARIEEFQGMRAKKLGLDAEWVLDKLVQVSAMSMQEKPVEKWDHAQRRLVPTGEYVYDSSGANKALELIGKHLGMFKDKLDHTVEYIIKLPPEMSDDA